MYVPAHFEETRPETLHALMRAHSLGALVTSGPSGLCVDHIPWIVDPEPAPYGTLRCHVARANPVWRAIGDSLEPLVVFQGPQAYISPSWYPSKQEHGKAVPTWNYAVVHARGAPRVIEDREWLLELVSALTDVNEAFQALPWQVSDAPVDFTEKMLAAIVGVEIPIRTLRGKWKVSQNRPAADRQGVGAGLDARGEPGAAAMAALVRETAG